MFTASHNPAAYNGIKLCRAGQTSRQGHRPERHQRRDHCGRAGYDGEPESSMTGMCWPTTGMRSLVDLSGLRRLRVAVDADERMAGHTTPAVLGPITSITLLPLYFELDGTFPNHEANPLDPQNLVDLQAHLVATGADIGLAFDGDADRCFVVDELGHPVAVGDDRPGRRPRTGQGNRRHGDPQPDHLPSSTGTGRGTRGHAVRARVGHSYIKELMADTGAIFGGEHSAHYYFRDFWGADSGMLAALHVLAALGEQQAAVRVDGGLPALRVLRRDQLHRQRRGVVCGGGTEVVRHRIHSIDHLDGVTVDLGNGSWFNLRSSNTEPLLRLNVEARSTEEVDDRRRSPDWSKPRSPRTPGRPRERQPSDTGCPRRPRRRRRTAGRRPKRVAAAASMAGAQVRATVAAFDEGALDPLRADQPPR